MIDEYLAVRVLGGDWPTGLPNDEAVLTSSRPLALIWFGPTVQVVRVLG